MAHKIYKSGPILNSIYSISCESDCGFLVKAQLVWKSAGESVILHINQELVSIVPEDGLWRHLQDAPVSPN